MCVCSIMSNSFVTPWTVAHQASLSMGFPRQEHWSGCHFLLQEVKWSEIAQSCPPLCSPMDCSLPGWDLPSPGIKPKSPALAGRSFNTEPPRTKSDYMLDLSFTLIFASWCFCSLTGYCLYIMAYHREPSLLPEDWTKVPLFRDILILSTHEWL